MDLKEVSNEEIGDYKIRLRPRRVKRDYKLMLSNKMHLEIKSEIKNMGNPILIDKDAGITIIHPKEKECKEEKEDEEASGEVENYIDNLCTPVKSINSLNDDCLQLILSYLPIRELIKFERVCKRWQKNSLALWRKVKNVNIRLDFKTKSIQIDNLEEILKRSGAFITHLDCSWLNKSTNLSANAAMELINKYCKKLTYLDISYTWTKKNYLNALDVNLLKNLKCLNIGNYIFSDEHLSEVLKNSVNLEEFGVAGYDYQGNQLLTLSDKCHTLAVSYSKKFSNDILIEILEDHPKIKNLDISGTGITPWALYNFTNQFTSLSLWQMDNFFDVDMKCYDELNFSNLKILDLNFNDLCLTAEILSILIQNCPEIEDLRLKRNKTLNKKDFRSLNQLKKLFYLDVSYTKITNSDLIYLAEESKQLKKLFCYGCNSISETGLSAIVAASPQLTYLAISSSKLTKTFVKSAIKSLQERDDKVPLSISLRSKNTDKISAEVKKLDLKDGITEFSTTSILRIVFGNSKCECSFNKTCICFDDEDTLIYFG